MKLAVLIALMIGGTPTPAPQQEGAGAAAPMVSVSSTASTSGRLRVELFASALPLRKGLQQFRVKVTEAETGKPAQGLQLAIQPWMPSMGHGIEDKPRVTPGAPGEFEVSALDLFMPGAWELRLEFSGAVSDRAVVALQLKR